MRTSRAQDETAMSTGEEIQDHGQPSPGKKKFNPIEDLRRFYHEVKLEMKKVSWPTRTEVVNTTIIVIIAVFFFAFYLFGTDLAFSYLIEGLEWLARKVF